MTCPLCACEKAVEFTRTESFGYPIHYVQCQQCGLVHQHSSESQAADPDFYAETYRKVYQANEYPTMKDLKIQALRAEHLIQFLNHHGVQSVDSVLDIGASAGVLLDAYQVKLGSRVNGVEPGKAYREFAASKGHAMFASVEQLAAAKPQRFGLVSLIHVVEHLEEPVAMLQLIREQLIAVDGRLLLEVPNFYAHDSYELAHLACYTSHSLRELVRKAGYEVLAVTRHGVPRSELLPLYITLLARPQSESESIAVLPERLVRQKRSLSMLKRKFLEKISPNQAWLPLPQ